MLALELAAIPAVVWLASWVGRRWGHRVSGLISGLPVISGPLLLFVALDASREFVAEIAWTTMAVAPAVGLHCLVFAWLARVLPPRPWQWAAALAPAWAGYFGAATALSAQVFQGPLGAALAIGEMLLAWALMPRPRGLSAIPRIPASETALRILVALAIGATVIVGAQTLGSRVSGVLLAFPITASVIPPITLALYGPLAAIRLLAGFVTGLLGFVSFFVVFGSVVIAAGPLLAGLAGVTASLAVVGAVLVWQSRRRSAR